MRPLPGYLLVASFLGSALSAQVVEPGAVIRATRANADDRLVGTLVSRTPDTLTIALRSGGVLKLPASSVRTLEVSTGRRRLAPAAKYAAIGAVGWGVVAAVVPYEACDPARYRNCNESNSMSKSEFVATQALGMAIIAGAVGAIRGSESWTRVEGGSTSAFIRPAHTGTALGFRLRL